MVLALILIAGTSRVFAHDPYEITSTIRIETNRTVVEIEMEFNAAMLLVGAPRSREPLNEEALFQSKLPALQQQAAQFFELSGAGGALIATRTNVTLGVENHVQFNLEYPPTHNGLKLNAAGLKALGGEGPFGTTVTVLDMVNLKVLGQSTLFASSPAAEFAAAVAGETTLVAQNIVTSAPAAVPATSPPIPEKPAAPAAPRSLVWIFVVLACFASVLILLLRRWQAARG